MAIKPEDIAEEVASALDCAYGDHGSGFPDSEMEVSDNVVIIRPKGLKRIFKITVEMYYD